MTSATLRAPGLPLKLLGVLTAALSLMSCGGDSSGGATETPSTIALSGVVADRGAWAGAELSLSCTDGQPVRTKAASDGRYSLSLVTSALPCLVHATSAQGEHLWSVATAAGTVNITPASDWIVARLLRQTTAGLQADSSMLRALTPATVALAQADVRQALAASGGSGDGDLIAAPFGSVLDAQLAAQQRLLATLTSRDIGPLALRHAFALQRDTAALGTALQRGRMADALGLPIQKSATASMPQLASGLVSFLTGPSDTVFGVNAEGAWRSTDGGKQWTYVNQVLAQVLRWRGRLWARDHDGLLASDDEGLSWAAAPMSPVACQFDKDRLWLSPEGRLWFFPDSMCPDVRDYYSDDGLSWQTQPWNQAAFRSEALQILARRQPPLRQVFFRVGNQERVTSCLNGSCEDSAVLDWPSVRWLMPVEGSGEIVAGGLGTGLGAPSVLAISPDGIGWKAMSFVPFSSIYRLPQGDLLASPGAEAGFGVNSRVQRSRDEGKTWQLSDPALNAVDGWITLGKATGLRKRAESSGALQLSLDGGQRWIDVPDPAAQADRRYWQRSPDGTLLRVTPSSVQASLDDGVSWRDVITDFVPGYLVLNNGPLWLDDRWVAYKGDRQLTSTDGLKWTDAPNGQDAWSKYVFSAPVSDSGVWVRSGVWVTTPHFPAHQILIESKDQGKTWIESQRSDALAFRCGGAQFLKRPRISDRIEAWQMRTDADPVWRSLALPAGIEATANLQPGCERGMLRLVAGVEPSPMRWSYYNTPSGRRGQSHWLSPDHGQHWFAVGRPGTDLFWVDGRWWSLGLDSVMLWP